MEVLESGWDIPKVSHIGSNNLSRNSPTRMHGCRLSQQQKQQEGPGRPLTTIIVCGLTETSVANLRHQVDNCYHRLLLAVDKETRSYRVLPGGGHTEAVCVCTLEGLASGGSDSRDDTSPLCYNADSSLFLPHYFTCGGVSTDSQWRAAVYGGVASGLRKYITQVVLNSSPGIGVYKALSRVEVMIRRGGERSCPTVNPADSHMVFDVVAVKERAWLGAVNLLERVFLSKRVTMQSY